MNENENIKPVKIDLENVPQMASRMTLRQHYAAMAMQGDWASLAGNIANSKTSIESYFRLADAMIEFERSEQNP